MSTRSVLLQFYPHLGGRQAGVGTTTLRLAHSSCHSAVNMVYLVTSTCDMPGTVLSAVEGF